MLKEKSKKKASKKNKNPEKAKRSEQKNKNVENILVVGDFVVDEHWLTGIHRSKTSSRTGLSHVRSLHSSTSTTNAFCAAGQTASILKQAVQGKRSIFNVKALGVWHEDDDKILSAMLSPEYTEYYTNYSLSKSSKIPWDQIDDSDMFNLGSLIENKKTKASLGTTKIIRLYKYIGSQIEMINRIDWEVRVPQNQDGWITDRELTGKKVSKLKNYISKSNIKAVVIKDICKGAVSHSLVKWLAEYFRKNNPDIPWFVSTKEWEPEWLKELADIDVKVFIVPQVAAQYAINTRIVNCWMTNNKSISMEAFEKIDFIKERYFDSINPIIIVLPEGKNIIAKDYKSNKSIIGIDRIQEKIKMKTQMASVFFAAVISYALGAEQEFDKSISNAIGYTENWMRFEANRVVETANWKPHHNSINIKNQYLTKIEIAEFNWDECKKNWLKAFDEKYFTGNDIENDTPIKSKVSDKIIELWRSMIEIDGYICCITKKRKSIQMLVNELKAFKMKNNAQQISCLITASPGSGKSFLIDCLQESLDFTCIRLNITNMISKDEILNYFDRILTTQAINPDKPIMIFVDEINAKINGEFVYSTFLSPLESGIFVRAEKNFPIKPCFWIFAGTETPIESAKVKNSKTEVVQL